VRSPYWSEVTPYSSLRYVEGMSNGELAEMFSQEKSYIAVRLHRIRQMLQVELER